MSDILNESIKEKRIEGIQFKKNLLYFRWIFLLLIIPIFFFVSGYQVNKDIFWKLQISSMVYNVAITVFVVLNKSDTIRRIMSAFFYIDVILISIFSYILGGIKSDIYLVLFFIIAYCGIRKDISNTVNISIFSIIAYSAATVLFEKDNLGQFNFLNLIIRDFFIILEAYGISLIIVEVNKYDEMHKKEFKLARTDKLTGLANRHYLEQKLEEEVLYSEYSKKPLNILMFDIDNFKLFNDAYGHIWGDKVLTIFGDIVMQSIRKTDTPVRYGGEEFIILIRDLDMEMAKSVGERIRRQLEKQDMFIGEGQHKNRVTVSCGVAQFPKHSNDIKKVIEYADQALYYAKKIGKNMVVSYDEIGKKKESVQTDIMNS